MALRKLPYPGNPEREVMLAELSRLYEAGNSVNDLARKYGVTYGCAHRWLVLAGVAFRPRGQQPRHKETLDG